MLFTEFIYTPNGMQETVFTPSAAASRGNSEPPSKILALDRLPSLSLPLLPRGRGEKGGSGGITLRFHERSKWHHEERLVHLALYLGILRTLFLLV